MAPRFIHLSVLGGKQKQKHVKLILQEKKKKDEKRNWGLDILTEMFLG